MAWYHAFTRRGPVPARAPEPIADEPKTVTASAVPVTTPRTGLVRTTDAWQDEAWEFYDTLG
jgi:hypothetical protein